MKKPKISKDTLFMGIDCGKYGAICVTDFEGNVKHIHDMPLDGYDVDIRELNTILSYYKHEDIYVTVEQMFPGFTENNKQAIWQQAKNFQSVFCSIHHANLQNRYTMITSRTWQSVYIDGSAQKKKSVDLALERTKRVDIFKKKKDGRAEAYLISEYGREYIYNDKEKEIQSGKPDGKGNKC